MAEAFNRPLLNLPHNQDMPRWETTEPREVRDARIIDLARQRKSSRQIAGQVGVSHQTVCEVIRAWRNPHYRRRRTDTNDDDSIAAFYS